MDLDRAQRAISSSLESLGGSARVAVLKAIVSQASGDSGGSSLCGFAL